MTDALDIAAAAAEAGARPALITGDAVVSFAELAAAVAARPIAEGPVLVRATPEIATVIDILRGLASGQPVVVVHDRLPPAQAQAIRDLVAAAPPPAEAALVVFTSGSTGAPRGVIHTRASVLAACASSAAHLGWRGDDVWLATVPLGHVSGLGILIRCLAARRPVALGRFAPASTAALMRRARVTIASWVPTQLQAVLDAGLDHAAVPHLRAALLGGAAAPHRLHALATTRGLPVLPTYGLTETFGQVVTRPLTACADGASHVGPALPGVELQAGIAGAPAAICLRAAQVAPGVLGRPGAERADRPTLVTRDLGELDHRGWLRVIGRADDVIITGGENVHPAQVEAALAEVAGLVEVAVVGVPDPRWGALVAAVVVLAPGTPLADATAAGEALASYQRPRRWLVVAALPRTPAGKVDRAACRALLVA
jgi:O-succinylbenzoic acid--CoA ligase